MLIREKEWHFFRFCFNMIPNDLNRASFLNSILYVAPESGLVIPRVRRRVGSVTWKRLSAELRKTERFRLMQKKIQAAKDTFKHKVRLMCCY